MKKRQAEADRDSSGDRVNSDGFIGKSAVFSGRLAGPAGIEPAPKVLETFVLPLNYGPRIERILMERHSFVKACR